MNVRNLGIVFSPTLAIPAPLFTLLLAEFDVSAVVVCPQSSKLTSFPLTARLRRGAGDWPLATHPSRGGGARGRLPGSPEPQLGALLRQWGCSTHGRGCYHSLLPSRWVVRAFVLPAELTSAPTSPPTHRASRGGHRRRSRGLRGRHRRSAGLVLPVIPLSRSRLGALLPQRSCTSS